MIGGGLGILFLIGNGLGLLLGVVEVLETNNLNRVLDGCG